MHRRGERSAVVHSKWADTTPCSSVEYKSRLHTSHRRSWSASTSQGESVVSVYWNVVIVEDCSLILQEITPRDEQFFDSSVPDVGMFHNGVQQATCTGHLWHLLKFHVSAFACTLF